MKTMREMTCGAESGMRRVRAKSGLRDNWPVRSGSQLRRIVLRDKLKQAFVHCSSKSYSTAARHASFVRGLSPCWRNEPRSGNHASQAEQLCTDVERELAVAKETAEELWRERFEERESRQGQGSIIDRRR